MKSRRTALRTSLNQLAQDFANAVDENGEIDIERAMASLARALPTLGRADGFEPWNADRFVQDILARVDVYPEVLIVDPTVVRGAVEPVQEAQQTPIEAANDPGGDRVVPEHTEARDAM